MDSYSSVRNKIPNVLYENVNLQGKTFAYLLKETA